MATHFQNRFEALAEEADAIDASKRIVHDHYLGPSLQIERGPLDTWALKVRHLIEVACGAQSSHFLAFDDVAKVSRMETNLTRFNRYRSVFDAAKDDFAFGLFASVRTLVQAEVFDDELEQAAELLRTGYHVAAAVVAGAVFETTLRAICQRHGINVSKLEVMNTSLVKAQVYNSLTQKRVTALAATRNSAAHGKTDEFTRSDVERMIPDIRDFITRFMS